jgi:hypothetical protein
MVPAVKNDTSKKIKKIQKKQTSEHSKFKNNVPKRKPIPVVRPLHGKKHARTGRSGPPSTTNPAMDTAARKRRGSIEWALGSTAKDTNGLRGKRGKREVQERICNKIVRELSHENVPISKTTCKNHYLNNYCPINHYPNNHCPNNPLPNISQPSSTPPIPNLPGRLHQQPMLTLVQHCFHQMFRDGRRHVFLLLLVRVTLHGRGDHALASHSI